MECATQGTIDIFIELYNLNRSIATEFVTNPKMTIPPSLRCIFTPGTVADVGNSNELFKYLNETTNNPNSTQNCKPVLDKVWDFVIVWNNYTDGIMENMKSKFLKMSDNF